MSLAPFRWSCKVLHPRKRDSSKQRCRHKAPRTESGHQNRTGNTKCIIKRIAALEKGEKKPPQEPSQLDLDKMSSKPSPSKKDRWGEYMIISYKDEKKKKKKKHKRCLDKTFTIPASLPSQATVLINSQGCQENIGRDPYLATLARKIKMKANPPQTPSPGILMK